MLELRLDFNIIKLNLFPVKVLLCPRRQHVHSNDGHTSNLPVLQSPTTPLS